MSLGARWGIMCARGPGGGKLATNEFVSHNNILHVCHTSDDPMSNRPSLCGASGSTGGVFDHDLYNGTLLHLPAGAEANGIPGIPVFLPGHGPEAGANGRYQLAPTSPGFDEGRRLPNFNDGFTGKAPDIGAHETDTPDMQFGVDACHE